MKIVSVIKSHKFISVAIAILLVVAVGSAVYANTRRGEEAKVVNSTQVTPVEETKAPVKAEEVETPATQEATISPAKTTQQSTQQTEQEEPAPAPLTRNEVLSLGIQTREAYQFNNNALQTRAVYNAVVINYDKNPSLFTEDKAEDSIKKCYAYLDSVKPEVVSLNITKGDCGL